LADANAVSDQAGRGRCSEQLVIFFQRAIRLCVCLCSVRLVRDQTKGRPPLVPLGLGDLCTCTSQLRFLSANTASYLTSIGEKGFAVGIIRRSKRVFSRREWEAKEVTCALQNGSREWIMLLAAICADGTALLPGLIYASKSSTL
jgi:hypothetical protein